MSVRAMNDLFVNHESGINKYMTVIKYFNFFY